jgi:hypothetical protein
MAGNRSGQLCGAGGWKVRESGDLTIGSSGDHCIAKVSFFEVFSPTSITLIGNSGRAKFFK